MKSMTRIQVALSCAVVFVSCSGANQQNTDASGGTTAATGGSAVNGIGGAGGNLHSTGGSAVSGGASGATLLATGGTPPTTGGSATGGMSATTGGVATGGNGLIVSATGGRLATDGQSASRGGAGSGGTSTGGTHSATGGTLLAFGGTTGGGTLGGSATGGARTAGATSTASGGATGAAGSSSGVKPTAGCGLSAFPSSGTYTIDVGGTQRSYVIKLPTGFDNTKPFRLVMTWHGLGGSAAGTANPGYEGAYYGLEPLAGGQAIFVSGQGLKDSSMGMTGWPNTNDQDVKFVKALVDYLRKTYCIDDARIFSVGKSYGGFFSNVLGCEMGDVFRAIAPQSSWLPSPVGTCVGQVAVWIDHGNTDTTIDFSRGQAARDLWLKANHCATTTKPWDSANTTCVAYDGCDADKPVIWCEFAGGHVMPSWAAASVWKFLLQF